MIPENKVCRRLPGIDGNAKMSKSLNNCIYLSDSKKEVKRKVMAMFTDPGHIKVSDPGKVEGNSVFTYLDAFCEDYHFEKFLPEYKNLDELKDHYRRGGLGDVKIKKFLNKVLEDFLEPIRERREYYAKDISKLFEIMENGSKEASDYGKMKLEQVKEAMGINYFDDKKLINELQRKYDQECEN